MGSGSAALKADPATLHRIVRALQLVWQALKRGLPLLTAFMKRNLDDADFQRLETLAAKLPNVTVEEVTELLALVRRGLLLDRQSGAATERALGDDELDRPWGGLRGRFARRRH